MRHMEDPEHDANILKAGTTIGNMFLVKFLQRHLLVRQDVTIRQYCLHCDKVVNRREHSFSSHRREMESGKDNHQVG